MPFKRGPNTYKGYLSPPTGDNPLHIKNVVRKVYGACRVQHPGEDPAAKSFCARVAWAAAKRRGR